MEKRKTLLGIAASTTLAGSMLATSNANAADNFLDHAAAVLGVTAQSTNIHGKEGKCGEGKCGGMKAGKEGKCGEGKCGAK